MGETYELLNVDKRQSAGRLGKILEFLFHSSTVDWLVVRLRSDTPVFFHSITPENMAKLRIVLSTHSREDALGVLAYIPDELVDQVVATIATTSTTFHDLVALALTSQRLWQICLPHMERKAQAIVASAKWHGDRVICVGEYTEKYGPTGLLTAAEKAEIKKKNTEWTPKSTWCRGLSLFNFCDDPAPSPFNVRQVFAPFLKGACHQQSRRILGQLVLRTSQPDHDGSQWIIRNLSKRKYIRQAALIELNNSEKKKLDSSDPFSLGDALMMRIGYSPHGGRTDVHRGEWAGDRFDVVSADAPGALDVDERGGKQSQWQDVSEKVMTDLLRARNDLPW